MHSQDIKAGVAPNSAKQICDLLGIDLGFLSEHGRYYVQHAWARVKTLKPYSTGANNGVIWEFPVDNSTDHGNSDFPEMGR